jgi:transcriptional regulator with XRE-family HTH domain
MNTLIGEYVRALRERRGLTQAGFAREAGIWQGTVCKIERHGYIPSRTVVEAMAIALHADMPVLLAAAGYIEVPRANARELAVMRQYVNTLYPKGGA